MNIYPFPIKEKDISFVFTIIIPLKLGVLFVEANVRGVIISLVV